MYRRQVLGGYFCLHYILDQGLAVPTPVGQMAVFVKKQKYTGEHLMSSKMDQTNPSLYCKVIVGKQIEVRAT